MAKIKEMEAHGSRRDRLELEAFSLYSDTKSRSRPGACIRRGKLLTFITYTACACLDYVNGVLIDSK